MMDERTPQGQFALGNKGGPGRPPKARELAYLAVVAEEVPLDDFRAIVRKAKEDATRGEDGRTRDYGRRWIADYLIGRPRQTLHINTSPGERDEFDGFSDDELEAIAAGCDDEPEPNSSDAGAGPRKPGGAQTQSG